MKPQMDADERRCEITLLRQIFEIKSTHALRSLRTLRCNALRIYHSWNIKFTAPGNCYKSKLNHRVPRGHRRAEQSS